MSANTVVVQGTVTPDGSLEIEGKIPLPPGKVQVTVVGLALEPPDHPFWQMMREIWAGQQARGHVPRSVEEVEADRRAFREKVDEEIAETGRLQDDRQRQRLREEADDSSREMP